MTKSKKDLAIIYHLRNEPRSEKTGLRGVRPGPTRSDTNQAVQPQKMARSLKFRI